MPVVQLLRGHVRLVRAARLEGLLAMVLLLGAAAVGTAYGLELLPELPDQSGRSASGLATVGYILGVNVPAALFLYSGTVTFGLTSFAAAAGVGLYLGHSVAVAVATFGAGHVVLRTLLYTPVELYGFVLALAAGLTPVAMLLDLRTSADMAAVSAATRRSLRLLLHALVVLTAAAGLELVSILLAP